MKKITTFFIGVLIIVLILTLLENQFNWGIPIIRYVLNKYKDDNWIEVSKFIGLCISGWLLLWQAILAGIRTEQGNKNVEIANENVKIGNKNIEIANKNIEIQLNNAIEERFNNAITLIGSDNVATRLGAIYALDHIAKDTYNKEKSYTKTIFQILCSYIRETTSNKNYEIKHKPSVEIQTIIDLLFKSHKNNFNGYTELKADLSYSYLCGADFSYAHCKHLFFMGAHCEGVYFMGAHCEGANFMYANCKRVFFKGAKFKRALFNGANCAYANFSYFSCEGADFSYADCYGADFSHADCAGADFNNTKNLDLFGSIGTPKNMP